MTDSAQIYYYHMDSPVGPFLIAGTDKALHWTSFPSGDHPVTPQDDWREDAGALVYAVPQFESYFAKESTGFDIPYTINGTPFQESVWAALSDIPFGQTASYGDIAKTLGKPGASRAVGGANNANPLPILIPCHRVIGADGSLTGFGGGLDAKTKLLEHEGIVWGSPQIDMFA